MKDAEEQLNKAVGQQKEAKSYNLELQEKIKVLESLKKEKLKANSEIK